MVEIGIGVENGSCGRETYRSGGWKCVRTGMTGFVLLQADQVLCCILRYTHSYPIHRYVSLVLGLIFWIFDLMMLSY